MDSKSITDPSLFESYPKESQIENGFLYDFGERVYRVLDMNLTGTSKLKVNLKVSKGSVFHIDTLDLYLERARERFAEVAAERIQIERERITQELYTLIEMLDKKRDELLKENPKAIEKEMSELERGEAMKFLRSPSLMNEIQHDFEKTGYIGEETPRLFGYLAAMSRFLDKPLGLLIVSRSGAGKSSLQDAISKFVLPGDLRKYTRVTGQSLFYQEEGNLKYAVLCIAEEKGAEDAIYSIRTLQSDQYLRVAVTTTDPKTGHKKTDEYHVEGPVVIIITTTNPEALDFETRNRFVILTIDESREQTERILERQRSRYTLEGRLEKRESEPIYKKHHNAQRLLKERVRRGVEVVNPYAPLLTYPNDKLLMRREHEKYMTLIIAIAFLRQFQKELKTTKGSGGKVMEYVEVDLEDIALANRLAGEILGRSLDELSPHTRTLLKQIKAMVDERQNGKLAPAKAGEKYPAFTRKDICDETGWSYYQVQEHLRQLVQMEYLCVTASHERNRFLYEVLWDGKGEGGEKFLNGLIDVEALRKKSKSRPKMGQL